MHVVVLAHRSPMVADVVARALVVLGVDARHGTPDEAAPGEVLVCDVRLGEPADVVLTGSSARSPGLDVAELVDVVGSAATASRGARRLHSADAVAGPLDSLTPREQEVLALVADGASNREVATRLAVTPNTARTHVQNLLTKLQVESRLAAGTLARRHGHVPGRA